ncbi:hypothetical protein [Rubrivirga sp. IMCC45206]|uniref:hypothetical protein n=1 Tax=Rubrivirga sp. IMCC45206 TaxID=3391614 RepID=UPI00398FBE34
MRNLCLLALLVAAPALSQENGSATEPYISTFEQGPGTDLVMVLFTNQDCGWSRTPAVQRSVHEAKALLQARAEAEGKRFSAVAVIKNYDWEEGIEFLSAFGHFDEVLAGRSWFNTGIVEHCFNQAGCEPATPMILVFERDVTTIDHPSGPEGRILYVFGPREYLVTVSDGRPVEESSTGIAAWVAAGVPLEEDWASN